MTLHGLTIEEAAELERIREARRRQHARLENRSQLIQRRGEVLRIGATIHFLEADLEHQLGTELEALDDRIAVLKHCRPGVADETVAMLTESRGQRSRIAALLHDGCRTVDLEVVTSLPGGRRRAALVGLPDKLVRRARELTAELHRSAIRVVDDIVDSDLLVLDRRRSTGPASPAKFRCADAGAETAARVNAFVDEIARLGSIRDAAAERLRFEAVHRTSGRSGPLLASQTVRATEARAAMDTLRALHAAIAEVESVCAAEGLAPDR